jgi:hypothetical protein
MMLKRKKERLRQKNKTPILYPQQGKDENGDTSESMKSKAHTRSASAKGTRRY